MSIKIKDQEKQLLISVPLTGGKGKFRIKQRSFFNEYGIPIATRQVPFNQNCYVEWQIGYDVVTSDKEKLAETTLQDKIFIGANGKEKALYELSEYLYHFYKWGKIAQGQLDEIEKFLQNLTEEDFIDNPKNFAIQRTQPTPKKFLGFDFCYTEVRYPLLVHKFGAYEVLTEIKVTEKQYAIGVQPMLYLCFPITELHCDTPLLGRVARTKESADFLIDSRNIDIFLELIKIFGILSVNHNKDIQSILKTIKVK